MSSLPIRRPSADPFADFATPRSVVATITPGRAKEILEASNVANRSLSPNSVAKLVDALTQGRWELNGETLIFATDGRLLDGQHRLAACAKSGVPLTTWVVFGVSADVFRSIDRGKSRSNGDDLGISGEKNRSLLASALALIWLDDMGKLEMIGITPASRDAFETLRLHPEIRDSVEWTSRSASAFKGLAPTRVVAFCHYRFGQIDREKADNFFALLKEGAGLKKDDPVLMLRKRLIENAAAKSKLPPIDILALFIKAWKSYFAEQPIKFLRWTSGGTSPEPFPSL